jgi:hypothetical protein
MRDLLLYASGILGLAAAFLHGWLGETRVFARVRIEPERLRTLIRLVWHCSVVAWAAVAVLLIAAPAMGSPAARCWIVGAAVVVFGFAAIANAWATRGRFFGWAVLTAVVGLAIAGCRLGIFAFRVA